MSEREDEALLRWAQAVADGGAVDWEEAALSESAPMDRLTRLRILATIASACGMPPEVPSPGAGTLFRWGHLEIRERIGQGVFGEVFLGWDTVLEREVAVKFLRAGAADDVAHVLHEGRLLAKIRHTGVVTVYGAEQLDGRIGIWMEHIRGRTLEDFLQERGTFGAPEAIRIGIDLCRALAAVHNAGLVHRDVKTRNVVRDDDGRTVLMDFGAGLDVRSEGHDADGITGTPIYLAPEVLRGEAASPRSDIYGLGVALYRLVTGGYPTIGTSLEALRAAHDRGEMRLLREARPDLPTAFMAVVERALASNPEARFASAEQMEAALVAARDAPRRTARRARVAALTVVGVLAVSLAIQASRMRGAAPASAPGRVQIAVADVVHDLPDGELDAVAGMLTTALEQSPALSVLTRSRMADILAQTGRARADRIPRSLGLEICRRSNAVAILVPSIRVEGLRYRITVDAVEPRSEKLLFSLGIEADDKEQIPPAIDTLARQARGRLVRDPSARQANVRPVTEITTPSLSAFHHYDRAERFIDRLALPEARAELETAVALDSTFALAHSRLAYVYWWLSDPEREKAQLAKAFALIDRVPEKQRYHLRAQGAMASHEGLEAARSILLEMERFYPDDKEMLYDIGDYSSHLNEFPTAIQYLGKVIAMDPGFARALQHLARVYRDMGRRDLFLEWARRYAAADTSWDSRILLGNALFAAGDTMAGIETLERGAERAPGHLHDFALFLANARFFQGRFADGLRTWDRWRYAAPGESLSSGSLRERATGRIWQGAYREALDDLEQAAELAHRAQDPAEESLARVEAARLIMVGRDDARAAWRQVQRSARSERSITYRDSYFSYWPYWGGVFKIHLLAGDLAGASALAKAKFAADKWYGPYVESYLHAARGECAQASAVASRVLEWGPAEENITLLYFLGRCQFEHGQLEEAAASLTRLQTLLSHMTLGTPYYAKSLLLLGEVQERKGDRRGAAQSYARLIELWRDGDSDPPYRLEAMRRLARLEPLRSAASVHGPGTPVVMRSEP